MGKKQAMRAAVKAGVTATPRATPQCWLNIHPRSLVVYSSSCVQNISHQLHSTPGTVTPTILFSVPFLLSLLFLFVFSKSTLTSPRYYVLALKLQPSLYEHIQLLFSSSELFWSRECSNLSSGESFVLSQP